MAARTTAPTGRTTAPIVAATGADVLVCGNAVFAADDPTAAVSAVRDAATGAQQDRTANGQEA